MFDKKTPVALEAWLKRTRGKEITPVKREVLSVSPDDLIDVDASPELNPVPVLCVTGRPEGASLFADGWLPRIAASGRVGRAISLRGQGNTPDVERNDASQVHDLLQEASNMPHQTVLIGHGSGAATVVEAATRYPAAAVVLLDPFKTKPPALPLVGEPKVLVVAPGSDESAPPKPLQKLTSAFGVDPLLFPGQENLLNGPGWEAVADAILSWLKQAAAETLTV